MYTNRPLNIGLFGFGVVGEGLYHSLRKTPSIPANIKKICVKSAHKERNAPRELFTTDRDEILYDKDINVVVEVIDDADAAFEIVSTAIREGKAVVSASKRMIAEHLPEILKFQQETNLPFLYEAAACASIPVIRNLEEYYDNDFLHGVRAVINGSTNFILTKVFEENLSFSEALALAQKLGFAESNPALDIEGYDAANKWCILLNHAYGIVTQPSNLLFTGIQHIRPSDALFAKERNCEIKLIAHAQKMEDGSVAAFVLPQLVAGEDYLASVRNEYNGVVVESSFADRQLFLGKGAGSFPTASAVLSDISALRFDYRYEYKKLYHHTPATLNNDFYLQVYVGFEDASLIDESVFRSIGERYNSQQRKYLSGTIHFKDLLHGSWWKQEGVSVVAMPNAVIEKSVAEATHNKFKEGFIRS